LTEYIYKDLRLIYIESNIGLSDMKKNLGITCFILLSIIVPFFTVAQPSYVIPGTLVEEMIYDYYSIVLDERDYFIIIDNTGIISGNYDRVDSYVIYSLTFDEPGMEEVEGSLTIKADEYEVVAVDWTLPTVFFSEVSFEIHASKRISAFLTDYVGLTQYIEEVSNLKAFNPKPIIISASVVGSILVILIVVVIINTNRIGRIDRIMKRSREALLQPIECDNCGEINKPGTTICEFCEHRIKITGERFMNIG
jgi:hypothetical protein